MDTSVDQTTAGGVVHDSQNGNGAAVSAASAAAAVATAGEQQQTTQPMDVGSSAVTQQNGSASAAAAGANGDANQGQKRQAEFDPNANANNKGPQKRMRTDNYNNNNKFNNSNNGAMGGGGGFANRAGKVDLRVLLPSKDAGAIIGRGGANIKKLRAEHKTIIQVPDCDGPERLLLIGGDTEAAINSILDIIPLLEENQKFGNAEQQPTEFRLLVHQSQAGCIIGRGGEKIKELRLKHNLDMKVYSECAPMSTERIAQMRGKPQDIVNCLREVLALLDTAPPKGMNRPYDPHNFNEFLSSQYGGYTTDKRVGNMGGGGGGPGQGNGGGNVGGRGGFGGHGGMQRGGGHGGPGNRGGNNAGGGFFGGNAGGNMNDGQRGRMGGGMGGPGSGRGGFGPGARGGGRGGARGGGQMGGDNRRSDSVGNRPVGGPGGGRGGMGGGMGGRGGFGGAQRGGMGGNSGGMGGYNGAGNAGGMNQSQPFQGGGGQQNNPGAVTNQVTIPNELAGAIIGPKGSKIAQIRDQSGAGITIDKPSTGTNDRIITITGTPEQIQNAQYLLQMTVKQSGLWQGQ